MFERFAKDDLRGVHYALNVFIWATVVWLLLRHLAAVNPVYAIASMIAASDPVVTDARRESRTSLINTAVGCVVGLAVLVTGGSTEWKLPIAVSIAVLVSSYLVRVANQWRQAPVTAALVIASGLTQSSKMIGVDQALVRVATVFVGCLVGILVSWLMSKIWPMLKRPEIGPGA